MILVFGSSFLVFSKTMKWRIRSSRVVLLSIPWIRVSSWLMRGEAWVLPSAVFQAMKRVNPALRDPARASSPSEMIRMALGVKRLGMASL